MLDFSRPTFSGNDDLKMLHSIRETASGPMLESECLQDIPSLAARLWMALANACRTLVTVPSGTYRPQAHYMRGPGPKCREKLALTLHNS